MMAIMQVGAGWRRAVAGMLLLGIGIGVVSPVLPGAPERTGRYDGDDADAAALGRGPDLVEPAVAGRLACLPVPASGDAALRADPPSPPASGRSRLPLLRSPPA